MTDLTNVRALLEGVTPQLLSASGKTIGRLLRLGAANENPRADNWDAPDFEHDGEAIAALLAEAPSLLDELEALPGDWLPIESAPKDGTEVQLFGMSPDGPRVSAGFWLQPEPPIVGDCGGECRCPEYGEPSDPFWCKMHGGNIEELKAYWMSGDGGFCAPWDATHWKPLSAPPRSGG